MVRQGVLFALCVMAGAVAAGCHGDAQGAQRDIAEYRDIGGPDDFDPGQNIYFDKDGGFGGNNAPIYWTAPTGDDLTAFYEDSTSFWWVTQPSSVNSGVTGSRAIKLHHYGRFRVRADRLPATATLILTIRYKDDLPAPVPVFSWNGSDWTKLGTLGGKRDHYWKTQQFAANAAAHQADNYSYVFKIGVDQYDAAMKGELLVDRIKLGTTRSRNEFPSDAPGLWPTQWQSSFSNLGSTMEFVPGEGPFFPFGVYDNTWISAGSTRTRGGSDKRDGWQVLQDAGLNCYVVHGWEQNWGSQWQLFPDEVTTQWAAPGVLVHPGLREHLTQAAAHHLKVIPNFLTDTRAYWIKNTYHGEANALSALGNVMARYANDPNVLMWYPVDEWDHEDDTYGKPHLYSHLLYQSARKNAPNRPKFLLCMGFLGPDTWRLAAEEADILGVDYYPEHGDIEGALQAQAKRLDDIRSVVGRTKPYILVPELWQDGHPQLSPAAITAEAYIALIHGARGILYFRAGHPNDPRVTPHLWDPVKQISGELFGANGLARLLLPASGPVDIMGENKIATCSNPDIHASLFQDANGHRTLLALNTRNQSAPGVQFTVAGLGSAPVTVRFEAGRSLPGQASAFTDDFAPLQRHVYDLNTLTH